MIAKQIKGKGFRGLIAYNQKKVLEGEAVLLETNLSGRSVNLMTREFHLIAQSRPNLSKCVYHVSLNLPASENIANVVFAEMAQAYLRGMGFTDNQYLIYRHFDCDHHHIHIVANRVCLDGSVVSDSMDYKRSEALVRQLEHDFGLESVLSSRNKIKGLRGSKTSKSHLRGVLSQSLEQQPTTQVFMERLSGHDIYCRFNRSKTTGYVSGVSFQYQNETFKGSALGKQYTWGRIKASLDYNETRDAILIVESNKQFETIAGNTVKTAVPNANNEVNNGKNSEESDILQVLLNSPVDIEEQEQDEISRKKKKNRKKRT